MWFEHGLWFKARFDYLKPAAIVDLKTFTNIQNKPIDLALHNAMAAMKYHIQAVHYTRAARKAAEFAAKNITTTYSVHRFGPDPEFLTKIAASVSHEFFLVFQKKGGAPLARGKKFRADRRMFEAGEASIAQAIELFKHYSATYGTDIWVDASDITDFEDALFPAYATEI